MNAPTKARTADAHGRLWGAKAQDWADVQEPFMRPLYEAVFARAGVKPGSRYLDVGCGAGLAAQLAAQMGARVCGIDAAEGMLAVARKRTPAGDFRLGDIEALPFPDRSFDLVTGFNAFQFAGDPENALMQARRVAAPAGTVVIVVWDKPEGMGAALLVSALKPLLPPMPAGTPGPFALSDESALRALAAAAGLTPLEILDVDTPWTYPDLATALKGLRAPGVSVKAAEHSGVEAVDRAHSAGLAPFRRSDGSYRVDARFRCLFTRP
jgi:SAM-dependent methyltransferase